MTNNPKISVCITVYNIEKYIAQCIESVISQDYKNIEIIISDNCSTDRSVEIIKSFLSDKRIKFYQNESNLGMYRNFDLVVGYSTGDYIAYLNADDYWNDKTFLSQAVDKISKFKNIVVFCGGKKYFFEQSKTFEDLSDDTDGLFDGFELFLRGLEAWRPFEMDAMVINAKVLKNIYKKNKWDVPGDDVYFFWRLCLEGKLYILRKPFLTFRYHNNNGSTWKSLDDFINKKLLNNTTVPIKAYEFAVKNNIFPKQILDKWLIKNIILFMTGSFSEGWDKFDILKNAYENMLIEKGYSLVDFGMDALFNRLHKINLLENNIYYSYKDTKVNTDENNLLEKTKIDLLRNDMDKIGRIKYDATIRNSFIKSGINENKIRDFFDVFIYSKIFNYIPVQLKNLNFVEKKLIGSMDKVDYENISYLNSDIILGNGWVLNIEENISFPDKVYLLLIQNNMIRYYVDTNLFERSDVIKKDNIFLYIKRGFSYIVPSHTILHGKYDLMILFVKDNYASILETNKILELSS